MVSGLRFGDWLEGISTYSSWRGKIKLVFLMNNLWDYSNAQIKAPSNATTLALYNKADAKAKLIILDGVKDHLIPHITRKDTAWDMWEALKVLLQNKNTN